MADPFIALCAAVKAENHAQVITLADKFLASNPDDSDVIKAKMAALLMSNQFDAAIALATTPRFGTQFAFEHAYALYRKHQHQSAMEILKAAQQQAASPKFIHLEAQLNYRLGNAAAAIALYNQLPKDEVDDEVRANMLASYVQLNDAARAAPFVNSLSEGDTSFEIAYNIACFHLEQGDLARASRFLDRAADLCAKTEELSPEDIQDELAVIRTQQGYIAQLQGREQQALDIYTTVLANKPSDSVVVACASNNLLRLRKNKHEKIFDSLKHTNKALHLEEEKLSQRQKRAIQLNRCLLLLHGKKAAESVSALQQLIAANPSDPLPAVTLAAVHAREKRKQLSLDTLQQFIAANKDASSSLHAQLALAQVHLAFGDIKAAVAQLDSIDSARNAPALVSTVVALLDLAGLKQEASSRLDKAVADSQANRQLNRTFLEQSADYKIKHKLHAAAISILEQLVATDANDDEKQRHLAQLLVAAAQVDPQLTLKYASQLPRLHGVESLDLAALEDSVANTELADYRRKRDLKRQASEAKMDAHAATVLGKDHREGVASNKGVARSTDGDVVRKKDKLKKKKRKPLYPKNFDPANPGPPPNPERWLPHWERTQTKQGRKRRQVANARSTGAQGSVPADEMVPAPAAAAAASSPKASVKPPAGKKGRN